MKSKSKKNQLVSDFDRDKLKKTDDGKWILPLTESIQWGEKKVTELHLSRPKAKHMRILSGDPDMDEMLGIVAALSGQPDGLIDELEIADATRACEFFGSFG